MAEFLPKLDVTLMIGVGAAFDFHAGRVKQAPRWMQRSGLEWFSRLCRAAAAGKALFQKQSAVSTQNCPDKTLPSKKIFAGMSQNLKRLCL